MKTSAKNATLKTRRIESAMLRKARLDAWEAQGRCCRYCLAPLKFAETTADHRVPRSKGGTNTLSNIVAACGQCNVAKGSLAEKVFNRAIRNPAGWHIAIHMAWSRRRMWLATHRACRRILYAVGMENTTPVGRIAA